MGRALLDVLVDFGRPEPALVERRPRPVPVQAQESHLPLAQSDTCDTPQTEVDVDAMIANAVAVAEASLRARLEEEFEARLSGERAAHAEQLEAVERRLGSELGTELATRFAALEASLSETTGDAVATMLVPVLGDEIARRAVAQLSRVVVDALSDEDAVRVRVTGPLALWEALREGLGERALSVEFTESASHDLSVSVDRSIYETRIGAWSIAVAELLE